MEEGEIIDHARGIGTVTREMVLARARELAMINGRSPHHVLESDWQEARRELVGEEGLVPADTLADSLPESERWEPTPVSTGHKVGDVSEHDEQTDAERLTEQGLAEAEHDRMVEGVKDSLRRDR